MALPIVATLAIKVEEAIIGVFADQMLMTRVQQKLVEMKGI